MHDYIYGDSYMKRLEKDISPSIGADPEFFIASHKDGKIVEANKVIPKNGLVIRDPNGYDTNNKCTIDGVQAEINPNPHSCRQGCAREYIKIFTKLADTLSANGTILHHKSMIHLTKKELEELSEESKRFGCAPSLNLYTNEESKITVDPSVYGYRSAGGHIHLGGGDIQFCTERDPKLVVRLLDLILGNTCVMIDRDPNQIERRKVYGRAGEYRLPSYGLEYRTLSNFWLRCYPLMSMVYGFARLGAGIAYNIIRDEYKTLKRDSYGYKYEDYLSKPNGKESEYREILKVSNESNIEKAISTNDFDLAKENWDNIKHILMDMLPRHGATVSHDPLNIDYLEAFEHFIDKGIDYWFKDDDIIKHWTKTLRGVSNKGWESFLRRVVTADMENNGNIEWEYGAGRLIIKVKNK